MKHGLLSQLASAFGVHRSEPPFGMLLDDAPEPRAVPPRRKPAYTDELREAVWQKARPMIGWSPDEWRTDHLGNPICRSHYADSSSAFGWEIGHIVDRANGGSEEISNLRPQQCGVSRGRLPRKLFAADLG